MRRIVAVAITAVLTLAGCGGEAEDAQDQNDAAAPTEASSQADSDQGSSGAGGTAPGLVVDKIGGGQIDFADLLGQDAVLWFWAPW